MINQAILGYADLSLHGQAWRAYGLQTADGVIQIAQPLRCAKSWRVPRRFGWHYHWLLLLPIMILCVAWIVRNGLTPAALVTTEVQRRDARSLAPLSTGKASAGNRAAGRELNRLLSRLNAAFAAQRDFVADAAHELRSPLTSLRLQLQLLDRAPTSRPGAMLAKSVGAAVERAIHLVEQLLTLARSDPQEPGADLGLAGAWSRSPRRR
jgi:two-component system OmpR family sensor kinase